MPLCIFVMLHYKQDPEFLAVNPLLPHRSPIHSPIVILLGLCRFWGSFRNLHPCLYEQCISGCQVFSCILFFMRDVCSSYDNFWSSIRSKFFIDGSNLILLFKKRAGFPWPLLENLTATVFSVEMVKPWFEAHLASLFVAIWSRRSRDGMWGLTNDSTIAFHHVSGYTFWSHI